MVQAKKGDIDYLDFLISVGKSKRVLRTGWVEKKIKNSESIAEHSFRLGVMAMVLADEIGKGKDIPLDKNKLIKMALLHDIGEVITGDIIIQRGDIIDVRKRDEKELSEKEGIREIFDKINKEKEYLAIFDEMIARDTPESIIFWELDKLEMALQAFEYEKEQNVNLDEFFQSVELYINDVFLKIFFNTMIKKRRVRNEGK
ncbi:MAG: HD domain-containing protein [Candidatus Levybacteria bacterium]|nr:HD domain-containing protein [Candidatus Levybacteria bacterium]